MHTIDIKNNDSKLLKSLNTEEIKDASTGQGVLYFHHRWSIMLSTFEKYANWAPLFKVIATTKTSYGAEFMSIL